MRLRFPELLAEHKPPLTPYGLAKASKGRISLTTIYRLNRNQGRVASFDGELLEREGHVKPARRKRGTARGA